MPEPGGDPAVISTEVSPEELAHPESLAVHLPPVPPEEGGLWSPARRPLTIGLVLTITLVAAEALAVSAAMPIVAGELGGMELYGLVFSAFLVGPLVGIVLAGILIDRRGLVLPFVGGLALFALGLLLAGLATSMPMLVGARLIQGIGGGAIPPVAYVAIGRSLPEHLRPRMFATLSTAWLLPGILGPGVAGIVAEAWSWRLVFLGLLPLIAVSGWLALRGLLASGAPDAATAAPGVTSRESRDRLRDALVMGFGVALLSTALTTDLELALAAVLAAFGATLTALAFRRLAPPGTLRAARGYPAAVLLRGVLTFAFFLVDAYVTLLLVEVRGWSAALAGLALTGATISWTAGSWTQARLSDRIPPERFVRVGFPVVGVGLAGLAAGLVTELPAWLVVPAFSVAGYGMGLAYAQFALIVLRDVRAEVQGAITAGLTLSDSLGTALGTSLTAALVSAAVRSTGGPGPGIGVAIGVAVAASAVGFVLAPRLLPAGRAGHLR